MQSYKVFIIDITEIVIEPIKVEIAVLNQKRGVQVTLDTPAIRHLVPALGKFLFIVAVVEMVVLAGLGFPGLDFLEAATCSYHFVFQDIDKSGGRFFASFDFLARPRNRICSM